MTFVGLDPDRAGALADRLDEAARDLDARAGSVAVLLVQAGISSSTAPAELRDVAAWAAYRSRDLRRRIDQVVAADHIGAGPRAPGFRFATGKGAADAAHDVADKLAEIAKNGDKKALDAELRAIAPYLSDVRFASALFKRLGPKRMLELLSAAQGRPDVAVLGRAVAAAHASKTISDKFLDGILEAAAKRAAAVDAYMHPYGAVSERDRASVALDEYMHRAGSPPGTYKVLESTAPLVPYLEAGTRVAIIGGAVVIVAGAGACVVLSEGTCLGPAAALAEQGAVVFSSEDPSLATGLFETLPLSLEDEATFSRFLESVRAALPSFQGGAIRGSSATGVKWVTGEPFDDASDIDLAIVVDQLFTKAEELGIKFRSGGGRTPPLQPADIDALGLTDVVTELSEIAGHPVKFMLYRSMDDIVARGPAILLPKA